MKAFEYAGPATIEDAVKALGGAKDGAALSGGTDLLSRMKDYVTCPDRVVYLKGVKPLAGISEGPGGLTIGAGTRLVDLVSNDAVKKEFPALASAAIEVGTPQIRNMATVGGNLLQRPRCWYYRSGFGLLGMKDGKSLVRAGDNRYHSIFMTDGDALFAAPSSLAAPLIALGATATIAGEKGERTIPVADLYVVPKTSEDRELTIGPGEVLTKVTIPETKGKNASYEARQKRAHDWPLVLASVCVELDGENVKDCRIVLGSVAPIPLRAEAAEAALKGKPINTETAQAAAKAMTASAKPLSENAYKVALTETVLKRAILAAAGNRYWEEA